MKISEIMKISESVSNIVYHFTHIRKGVKILTNDEFVLTPIYKNNAENSIINKVDDLFFLSTTRSLQGEYHKNDSSGIIFKLNGTKLSNNYSGKAINYYNNEWDKNEMEDRVFSKKPRIPAIKFISEILVALDYNLFNKGVYTINYKKEILFLLSFSKKNNIPIKIYKSMKALVSRDTKELYTYNELKKLLVTSPKEEEITSYNKSNYDVQRNYRDKTKGSNLKSFIEISLGKNYENYQDNSKNLIYKMLQYSDTISSLEADIHNSTNNPESYSRKLTDRIGQIMKLYKVSSFSKLYKIILDKVTKEYEEHENKERLKRASSYLKKYKSLSDIIFTIIITNDYDLLNKDILKDNDIDVDNYYQVIGILNNIISSLQITGEVTKEEIPSLLSDGYYIDDFFIDKLGLSIP